MRLGGSWGFVRRGGAARTAGSITAAGSIAAVPTSVQDFVASDRDQKLFSHFGEAGTAVLTVKQVEYGGHDRTLASSSPLTSDAIHFGHFTFGGK
jgi:hypothetical protein